MSDPETSLEEVQSSGLSLDDGRSLLDIANRADALVSAIKKIKTIVFQITNADDWIDEQGKPYLQVSGAEKIRPLFGIEWDINETPDIDEDGIGHRIYKFQGRFSMGGKTISIIGSRSSKDPFFSRAHKADIPPEEINMANVEKAAFTNTIGNGITRILGIRNLTWAELTAAGIVKGQSRAVSRKISGHEGTTEGRMMDFGRDAGKPLPMLSIEQLEWYGNRLSASVNDPEYARFKAKNEKNLNWITEEIESRTPPEPTDEKPKAKAKTKKIKPPSSGEYEEAEEGNRFSLMGGE